MAVCAGQTIGVADNATTNHPIRYHTDMVTSYMNPLVLVFVVERYRNRSNYQTPNRPMFTTQRRECAAARNRYQATALKWLRPRKEYAMVTVRPTTCKVERLGVAKARTDTLTLLVLAVMAGAFIAIGALFYTVVVTEPSLGFGATRLLGGLSFSVGLILVVVAGGQHRGPVPCWSPACIRLPTCEADEWMIGPRESPLEYGRCG